uniref:5-oxoprolinase n=1 Tax=Ciona savignyi TaxID=51511 RepID=H2Y9L4_CIOSA
IKVKMERGKFQFAIDRGGTFTDIYAKCPGQSGKSRVMKLLSVDPSNYPDAPREGIRRILEEVMELGVPMPADDPVDTSHIDYIRMGTTVATNALLERKGERMALVITQGFRDLLHIGNQSRPKIFDLQIKVPDVLYEDIVEVEERIILHQERCSLNINSDVLVGSTNEKVTKSAKHLYISCYIIKLHFSGQLYKWTKLDENKLRKNLDALLKKGIKSLAVVLMHSYTCADHEVRVGEIAMEMGFTQVSLSSKVMSMVKLVPRGFTGELENFKNIFSCVDAYLTPSIQKYLAGFQSGFDENLKNIKLLFMQSDGGLTPVDRFNGSRAMLSGPAGGVVGYAMTSHNDQPVIGFDMGGTSTDVSRYNGQYEHVFESTSAGVTIQAPQLDINTVAAGGGSMLFFRSGMFVVGPQSAGAHPGPTCYRKGGPLTVTDANLCLGRLLPEYFPKIFGTSENLALDESATRTAFEALTVDVNEFMSSANKSHEPLSVEQVAMGFIRVANESMCRPIRALTQAKGHDTSRHVLSCFGGAGGQHACAIARSLGMTKVFIHKYSGILSAYGMALADVVHEAQESAACHFKQENISWLDSRVAHLSNQCLQELKSQGFSEKRIELEVYLNLRYDRTDCALMCSPVAAKSGNFSKYGDFLTTFTNSEFGFTIPGRTVIVDDIRVRGVGKSGVSVHKNEPTSDGKNQAKSVQPEATIQCYFEDGFQDTSVYLFENLSPGHKIVGSAIIIDKNSTILVEPDCIADVTTDGTPCESITIGGGKVNQVGTELDSIQLSIFSHRFMSIAEQMGRILQRTAISTNIKERLDFSCALFGPDGGLVSNAPHIPVHLGAMQEAVQYQMRELGDQIKEGDCILSNHPLAGGSHLPDLTVITPVFTPEHETPIFFLANRGHHADIGGTTPGSMPPHSTSIKQEGAVFKSFKLVRNGEFQEKAVFKSFVLKPKFVISKISTSKIQNYFFSIQGIHLVNELVETYGLNVVQAYMAHIQSNAEVAVRNLLRDVARSTEVNDPKSPHVVSLNAQDYMDDGSMIKLRIDIDAEKGSAIFDFSGTSPMVLNNLNAPKAITLSAIIYCLRCMVGYDVPLNQGCLTPVNIRIPKWSILDPEETAAVVGGNVLTSQRIVDVIMKAFKTCAASQGCMNNITFGDDEVGYYETVAGGAGAGPTWHGRSGIHTHMTNTRITDPEILERRYPVILEKFQLNPGTGGGGEYSGGDGVIRQMLFRKDLVLSVLTERRVFAPYGLDGGQPGKTGNNLLLRHNGPTINLGGKNSVEVHPGDVFRLLTPGGGGFGSPTPSTGEP